MITAHCEGGRHPISPTSLKPADSLPDYTKTYRPATVAHVPALSTWRDRIPQSICSKDTKKLFKIKSHYLGVEARRNIEPPLMCRMAAPFYQSSGTAVAHDRRSLVYQVTQDFHPLWELGSVEDFEQCYIDLLDTHFHAYNHACVLHRDISENNAMAQLGADRKVTGLLNDWYLSCFVNADGVGEGSTSQHRTGTTPFMAVDLQRAASGKRAAADHRYCHDLESFFWLLVWAVVHFDLTNKRRLDCVYTEWNGSWKQSVSFKRDFLNLGDTLAAVLDDALDMWKDVVQRWVKPLARMIFSARERSIEWDGVFRVLNDDVYAKEMNFDLFMRTIKQTPKKWAHEKED